MRIFPPLWCEFSLYALRFVLIPRLTRVETERNKKFTLFFVIISFKATRTKELITTKTRGMQRVICTDKEMAHRLKKFLLVATLLCIGLGAKAQTSATINGITYNYYQGYYSTSGQKNCVVVTDVSNTISHANILSSVYINGQYRDVTIIGYGCFQNCGSTLKK